MTSIYDNILSALKSKDRLLAVLIDPDKMKLENISGFIRKVNLSVATHIFVGGSEVGISDTEKVVVEIKKHTKLPVVLFPGDVVQITGEANAILFLSLLSGRNAEYLIGKHINAVSKLKETALEVLPTGYLLIENGKKTSVERVSGTEPMVRNNVALIIDTAKAGELLGMKLIYLEAGSGAIKPIDRVIISEVKEQLSIPLIVGGGIRSKAQIQSAYSAGADIVVIGTAFEDNEDFFEELKSEL